jgi:hypothetical protein
VTDQFTGKAKEFWDNMPMAAKTMVLNNVWCVKCVKVTTIVHYSGSIKKGDLVLKGKCQRCCGDVARVVENE